MSMGMRPTFKISVALLLLRESLIRDRWRLWHAWRSISALNIIYNMLRNQQNRQCSIYPKLQLGVNHP